MTPTLVLVERDHDAIAPKDELHVQDHSGELGLEHIGHSSIAGKLSRVAKILCRKVRQNIACVLFVESELQTSQLATSLQRDVRCVRSVRVVRSC